MPASYAEKPKLPPAALEFEAQLWAAADKMRGHMDAREPSGARQPERSGDSPADSSPTRPGQSAKGSPKGERGGANQCKHVILRDMLLLKLGSGEIEVGKSSAAA